MNNYVLGLELLIIGMGTVFISLYLLSVFLHYSGKFFGPESEKKKNEKIAEMSKAVEANKENKIAETDSGISAQKVAAVTAAVYGMLNEQANYRIISIQKSNKNWKR